MICPYCKVELPIDIQNQFCIICRKPFVKKNGKIKRQTITVREQLEIFMIGLITFFLLYSFYKDFYFGFSSVFYLSFASAFSMGYRMFRLLFKTKYLFVKEYFPHNQLFFVLMGPMLLISIISIDKLLSLHDLTYLISVPEFSNQFLIGYSVGLIFILLTYYYYGTEKIRKRILTRKDL